MDCVEESLISNPSTGYGMLFAVAMSKSIKTGASPIMVRPATMSGQSCYEACAVQAILVSSAVAVSWDPPDLRMATAAWRCPACTFANGGGRETCAMCSAARPPPPGMWACSGDVAHGPGGEESPPPPHSPKLFFLRPQASGHQKEIRKTASGGILAPGAWLAGGRLGGSAIEIP